MNRILTTVALLATFINVNAQYISGVTMPDSTVQVVTDTNDISVRLANTITAAELKEHLYTLASDEYQGRETGEPGVEKAAIYLTKEVQRLQFPGDNVTKSNQQSVAFTFTRWEDTGIYVNGNRFKHLWDYISFPNLNEDKPVIATDEILFLGYGIDDPKYSDYKKNKVEGKVIIINKGEPIDKKGNSRITGTTEESDWASNIERKLKVAKENGVTCVLIIEDNIKKLLNSNRRKLLGNVIDLGDKTTEPKVLANHAYISTNVAKEIFGKNKKKVIKARKKMNKKGRSKAVKCKTDFKINQSLNQKVVKGKNILAFVKGQDLKEEVIVVSAHYDHIGTRGDVVYNGADDNGSGTSTLLELAEAFATGRDMMQRPRRSVLFLWVTGEEKGLLGSSYFADSPSFSKENMIANVNIDMVGRQDKKYADNPEYIYVIGSDRLSTDLHKINEDMNSKYSQIALDYTYNSEDDPNRYYYRSDHYNFAKNGVPAIFFFNGVHEDYHQAGDTPDKINYEKMERIGRHVFHLVWELANRDDRIRVDGEVK